MERYWKVFLLFVFFTQALAEGFAQSGNYWSTNLNSEAALLGGAVVGGGSGVTSIFYNPAGISEIEKSNVTLNSSMLSLTSKSYLNAMGTGQDLSQMSFEVKPRFVSYQYRSKKIIELSWELSMFNKDAKNIFLHGSYTAPADKYGFNNGEQYYGYLDFLQRYNDYYAGIGTAYSINDKWKIGLSLLASIKDLTAISEAGTSIYMEGTGDYLTETTNLAGWHNYKMVSLMDVRVVSKIGVRYYVNREMSLGLTVSLPSLRVFSYANGKKVLDFNGIKDNKGNPVPDYFKQETISYVKAQLRDPFSIAIGVRRRPFNSKNIYSITIEWFAKIKPYKAINAEEGKSIFGEQEYGTEFSNYYMGNRSVINFAFGYKRVVRTNLELLFGFKSDFFSYYLPASFEKEHQTANTFIKVGADMLHLSSGANFIFKNKFKINLGGSLSYARSSRNKQFINFEDANWYDYDTHLALQGKRGYEMIFREISLGLFLGFSLDF
jgi:hypothetical protein